MLKIRRDLMTVVKCPHCSGRIADKQDNKIITYTKKIKESDLSIKCLKCKNIIHIKIDNV